MTRNEILQNKPDLQRADLAWANLRKANLQRAGLAWANLAWANLRKANLQRAGLAWANLQGADLRRADLRRADLRRANLRGADLRKADLQRADLAWANLQGADLQGADLREANLQGADLQRADLAWANLQGADLREADLDNIVWNYLTTGIAPPPCGDLVAWKKVHRKNADDCVIRLFVNAATPRTCATTRKMGSWGVYVYPDNPEGCYTDPIDGIYTAYNPGTYVMPDSFSMDLKDRWNECTHKIHWFLSREEAEGWEL